jgi:hypothetical protein
MGAFLCFLNDPAEADAHVAFQCTEVLTVMSFLKAQSRIFGCASPSLRLCG